MVVQIVEDELLISMWVEDALRDVGYTVLNVETADQALVNFESRDDIDILFTDVNMPGSMDGLELAATVRERWLMSRSSWQVAARLSVRRLCPRRAYSCRSHICQAT